MKAIWFGNHLYQPLLCLDSHVVEISPAPLNKGERQFVEDLKAFHDEHVDFFGTRELYLLRNLSKGRGVGFFEAGNFYPDFILWLLARGKQQVIFVDPKGIRNLGPSDPKIQFYETIKNIEQRLGDPDVQLESFIVSNTPSSTMHRQVGHGDERDAATACPLSGRGPRTATSGQCYVGSQKCRWGRRLKSAGETVRTKEQVGTDDRVGSRG